MAILPETRAGTVARCPSAGDTDMGLPKCAARTRWQISSLGFAQARCDGSSGTPCHFALTRAKRGTMMPRYAPVDPMRDTRKPGQA